MVEIGVGMDKGNSIMNKTTVVNKYHGVAYDVYCGRGSKWGNPFSHLEGTKAKYKVKTREESITEHRKYMKTRPDLMSSLHELQGKVLCCFCKPKPCHCDTLAELADTRIYIRV